MVSSKSVPLKERELETETFETRRNGVSGGIFKNGGEEAAAPSVCRRCFSCDSILAWVCGTASYCVWDNC